MTDQFLAADESTAGPPPEGNGPPPDADLPPPNASPIEIGVLPSDAPPPGNGPPPGSADPVPQEIEPGPPVTAEAPRGPAGPPPDAAPRDGSLGASPVQSGSVCLTGILSTIFGGPGGPIYFLADATTGRQTQILLDEAVARPAGGVRALDRQRVTVRGEPAGLAAAGEPLVRATWIALGEGACG